MDGENNGKPLVKWMISGYHHLRKHPDVEGYDTQKSPLERKNMAICIYINAHGFELLMTLVEDEPRVEVTMYFKPATYSRVFTLIANY